MSFGQIRELSASAINNENLFIALVFYGLRWCGLPVQDASSITRQMQLQFDPRPSL